MDGQPQDPNLVTVREVYALIDGIRREQEVAHAAQAAHLDRELEKHKELHVAHDAMHQASTRRFRWALATALSFGGLFGGFANHVIDVWAKR